MVRAEAIGLRASPGPVDGGVKSCEVFTAVVVVALKVGKGANLVGCTLLYVEN